MMSDTIEYRAWIEDGTLLGFTHQEDTPAGYRAGLAYVRELIATEVAELPEDVKAEYDVNGSPYSIQICKDDTDVTGHYGIGWPGEWE
jgi:hypothetical protein